MSNKSVLKIDWATHEAARFACENWHYSKCIPKSKLIKVGVWEDGKYIGAVIYGHGATASLGAQYGLTMQQCCELTRVALTKHLSPVSRILSLSLMFLKKKCCGLRLVVSFADQTQGHHGGIYQATNWIYSGETSEAEFYRDPKGKLWHPRRASKTFNVQKKLVTKDWTVEIQRGKHRYLMPLDDDMRKQIMPLAKPYPKRVKKLDSENPSEQGGAVPTDTLQTIES